MGQLNDTEKKGGNEGRAEIRGEEEGRNLGWIIASGFTILVFDNLFYIGPVFLKSPTGTDHFFDAPTNA